MAKKYTVDYFIKKFKAIPANQWTTGAMARGHKKCALAHCSVQKRDGNWACTREADALFLLLEAPGDINDNVYDRYSAWGRTPKTRILNALKRVKAGKSL